MKSATQNIKDGQWRVVPESADDLWLLSMIIEAGDRCTAFTFRKMQVGESTERKPMVLTLEVEKVALEGQSLRVLGIVREGPEDVPRGEHHSFMVEAGESITIIKTLWAHDQVQRMREACESQPPSVLIVVFERDEANIALMRRTGYQVLARLTGNVEKKRMAEKQGVKFYDHLVSVVREYDTRHNPKSIILGSPAFWKDEFIKSVNDPVLRKKFIMATTSGGHEQAIGEVLRRDEVRSALAQDRVAKESHAVEQVLAGIAKGSAVVYGMRDVQSAADVGAVATLLVTESRLAHERANKSFAALDTVLRGVAHNKGDILIIGAHDAGKKLDGLGGIAALLRYRLQ